MKTMRTTPRDGTPHGTAGAGSAVLALSQRRRTNSSLQSIHVPAKSPGNISMPAKVRGYAGGISADPSPAVLCHCENLFRGLGFSISRQVLDFCMCNLVSGILANRALSGFIPRNMVAHTKVPLSEREVYI